MSTRSLLIAAVALAALAGCSSHADKPTPHAAASTSSVAPSDPYDAYLAHDDAAKVTAEIKRDEAVSVAGNTCDNTVDDMSGLIGTMQQLYTGAALQNALTDRANFIDAYCPSARVVYDAATQQVVGKVMPAAH